MPSGDVLKLYRNEELATEAFREYRLQKGIVCKKCGGMEHYWLAPKHQFQCKKCKFRTTLQSGTLLEGSKLPVSYFFIALYLLKNCQSELTIQVFQQYTGHKYSEPLYDFLKKVKSYVKTEDHNAILILFLEVASRALYGD